MKSARVMTSWRVEIETASVAEREGDVARQWSHLERAHVLSQPFAGAHVRTHLAMLERGVRDHDAKEAFGQILRLALAAPGSWLRRYPVGNIGRANVSAFEAMPIPDDLRAVLDGTTPTAAR